MSFENILREDLTNYSGASNLKFNEKIKALQASGEDIYHFGFGQSPFPVPEPFVKQLKETAHINDYLSVAGLLELRQEIVAFHKDWEDVKLDMDNIIGMELGVVLFLKYSINFINCQSGLAARS